MTWSWFQNHDGDWLGTRPQDESEPEPGLAQTCRIGLRVNVGVFREEREDGTIAFPRKVFTAMAMVRVESLVRSVEVEAEDTVKYDSVEAAQRAAENLHAWLERTLK